LIAKGQARGLASRAAAGRHVGLVCGKEDSKDGQSFRELFHKDDILPVSRHAKDAASFCMFGDVRGVGDDCAAGMNL
jgi:hypothetical protein